MATSRTGTGIYLRNSRQVKAEAQRDGITHCPRCRCLLDYERPLLPNSAETDHVIPHKQGGSDDKANLVVVCRHCNRQMSDKRKRVLTVPQRMVPATTVAW